MNSYDYVIIAYAVTGGSLVGFSLFTYQSFHRAQKAFRALEKVK